MTRLHYGLIGVGIFVLVQFFEHINKYGWPQ
jgi:hypothetical protein